MDTLQPDEARNSLLQTAEYLPNASARARRSKRRRWCFLICCFSVSLFFPMPHYLEMSLITEQAWNIPPPLLPHELLPSPSVEEDGETAKLAGLSISPWGSWLPAPGQDLGTEGPGASLESISHRKWDFSRKEGGPSTNTSAQPCVYTTACTRTPIHPWVLQQQCLSHCVSWVSKLERFWGRCSRLEHAKSGVFQQLRMTLGTHPHGQDITYMNSEFPAGQCSSGNYKHPRAPKYISNHQTSRQSRCKEGRLV